MSFHRTGDAIEIRRPAAPGLEFMVGRVEGCVACCAGVDTFGGHVFVVFADVGGFGTLAADDAELFGGEDGLPFRRGFLDGVVCHVVVVF